MNFWIKLKKRDDFHCFQHIWQDQPPYSATGLDHSVLGLENRRVDYQGHAARETQENQREKDARDKVFGMTSGSPDIRVTRNVNDEISKQIWNQILRCSTLECFIDPRRHLITVVTVFWIQVCDAELNTFILLFNALAWGKQAGSTRVKNTSQCSWGLHLDLSLETKPPTNMLGQLFPMSVSAFWIWCVG